MTDTIKIDNFFRSGKHPDRYRDYTDTDINSSDPARWFIYMLSAMKIVDTTDQLWVYRDNIEGILMKPMWGLKAGTQVDLSFEDGRLRIIYETPELKRRIECDPDYDILWQTDPLAGTIYRNVEVTFKE